MTPADLRAARLRLGMTQAQLAEALGLNGKTREALEVTVSQWERGKRPISGPVRMAIEGLLEKQQQSS